jgi:hypothetical protein
VSIRGEDADMHTFRVISVEASPKSVRTVSADARRDSSPGWSA